MKSKTDTENQEGRKNSGRFRAGVEKSVPRSEGEGEKREDRSTRTGELTMRRGSWEKTRGKKGKQPAVRSSARREERKRGKRSYERRVKKNHLREKRSRREQQAKRCERTTKKIPQAVKAKTVLGGVCGNKKKT